MVNILDQINFPEDHKTFEVNIDNGQSVLHIQNIRNIEGNSLLLKFVSEDSSNTEVAEIDIIEQKCNFQFPN